MNPAPFKTIDLKHGSLCSKLCSRKVWQVLFNEYRKWNDLTNMDSMLCDLYTYQKLFEEAFCMGEGFIMRWYFLCGDTYNESLNCKTEQGVIVKYDSNSQTILFYQENGMSQGEPVFFYHE